MIWTYTIGSFIQFALHSLLPEYFNLVSFLLSNGYYVTLSKSNTKTLMTMIVQVN